MIKILHTADLHLDAPVPFLEERERARQAEFFQSLERSVNLAIKNEVQLFLIAGGLFATPVPERGLIEKTRTCLKRLVDRGIHTVVMEGSGEEGLAGQVLPTGGVLLVDDPHVFALPGTTLCLHPSLDASFESRENEVHVGVAVVGEAMARESDLRALEGLDFAYLALGGEPEPFVLEGEGGVFAANPGAPEGKDFSECGARHVLLVAIDGRHTAVEKLAVNRRRLERRRLDLTGCGTQEEAETALLAQADADLLLELELTGVPEAPLAVEKLQKAGAEAFYYLRLSDATDLVSSALAERMRAEETVRGLFARQAAELVSQTPPEEQALVREAFNEVLVRFDSYVRGEK